ncbi:MAG TPA: multiheme c-type cytochrome [Pirellulales bacterium]
MPLAILSGCHAKAPAAAPAVQIIVSGDTAGWIVPCGCTTKQLGGLPRRGAYVAAAGRPAEVVVADVGGAPGGTSPYDLHKFAAILRGEHLMDVAAHNIGAAEARLDAQVLVRLASEAGVPLVSANVRGPGGRHLVAPLRIVTAGGRKIALTGVLSPSLAGRMAGVDPPRQAVLDALAAISPRPDLVIVLAYLPTDELRELTRQLPEADAVIGGPTGQSIPPERVGPTLLASATNKGKFLVHLTADSSKPLRGTIAEMSDRWPDDARQIANLDRYRASLAERDFSAGDTSLALALPGTAAAGYRLAGTEACRRCHADDHRVWKSSPHAHAWQTLAQRTAWADPDCQQCHTTGYGLPGGFVSARRTPRLVDVGCESCHGPSAAHVAHPATHTAWFALAADRCVRCHDHENSPQFAYDSYWPRIEHGPAANSSGAAADDHSPESKP